VSKTTLSLYELNQQIKGALQTAFPGSVWVRAEIAELRENRNGHCYLDLVEKDEATDQVIARMRAMIWNYTYRMLKPFFETTTGQPFTQGIKVLIQGVVEFQEVYGLSFTIRDIDPAYTLGDIERRRLEVIRRLESEGVINMNKELPLPLVPQKIAIISSPTAAGYGDFVHQLENNSYGIKFYHKLFPTIMQGQQAPESITAAFDKIYEQIQLFDVVVLIRGGGASLDLLCFDDYWLCYNIAQFPIPVLTGIGHERDRSVADMVAHSNLKTPTAVAEFLITGAGEVISAFNNYALELKTLVRERLAKHRQKSDRLWMQLKPAARRVISAQHNHLLRLAGNVPHVSQSIIREQHQYLDQCTKQMGLLPQTIIKQERRNLQEQVTKLRLSLTRMFTHQTEKINFIEKNNRLNDPVNILNKGFTLTYHNGRLAKDAAALTPEMEITTHFRDGSIKSKINKKQ
jgi:exodeoxyribonuclease VII large subunit